MKEQFAIITDRYGADTAFDDWTLTGYFASRFCTIRIFLIANTFAKVKEFVKGGAEGISRAFSGLSFAPAVA